MDQKQEMLVLTSTAWSPPPNLEFLRVLQTHFHPQLLRQNLGKQQKQQFPKVFKTSSFMKIKQKFAKKKKKKKNQNSSSNLTMQQQQTSEKIRTYQSISRASLSRLHSTRTIHTSRNLTDSEKKIDRSPDLLTTTGFVAAKTKLRDDACQPAAKIVFQNGLQTKTDSKKKTTTAPTKTKTSHTKPEAAKKIEDKTGKKTKTKTKKKKKSEKNTQH